MARQSDDHSSEITCTQAGPCGWDGADSTAHADPPLLIPSIPQRVRLYS